MPNVSKEDELWGRLYGLLCRYSEIQFALAGMLPKEQRRLDDLAANIIRDSGAFTVEQSGESK